jgi:hypothetical protein
VTIRELIGRLMAWRGRRVLERELAADLDAHVALLARDLEHEGLSPQAALNEARRQVGNLTSLRERSWDAWSTLPASRRRS